MHYTKPSWLHYRIAQLVCGLFARLFFRRKVLRNEIKGVKGPFVVIANHQAAFDFVNLIGLSTRPMSFVISNSFYNSLPITGFLKKMGVIPKQQFQTTVTDMKNMRAVIEAGQPLVIYPAGLMCEDGLSTPIPTATYKFLKWLGVDIYVAKVSGTYFAMPKWTSGIRPGRTYMDVYQLVDAETLSKMDVEALRVKTDEALMFDAYRDQENHRIAYAKCDDIRGLEQVLYVCPHCCREYTMQVQNGSTLACTHCGYTHTADRYGLFSNTGGIGEEMRYVSDWSRWIYRHLEQQVVSGSVGVLSCRTKIHMIDFRKHKFVEVGQGTVTLTPTHFLLEGDICAKASTLQIPIAGLPTLPFSPGRYFEIQDGKNTYRCVLEDGRLVMKFINLVKIYYARNRNTLQMIEK